MAFACLSFPNASLTSTSFEAALFSMVPTRHEWCHFMKICMGNCAVKDQRMLIAEIHSEAGRKPQKGSGAFRAMVIHKSCWNKDPDYFIILRDQLLIVSIRFFFNRQYLFFVACNSYKQQPEVKGLYSLGVLTYSVYGVNNTFEESKRFRWK